MKHTISLFTNLVSIFLIEAFVYSYPFPVWAFPSECLRPKATPKGTLRTELGHAKDGSAQWPHLSGNTERDDRIYAASDALAHRIMKTPDRHQQLIRAARYVVNRTRMNAAPPFSDFQQFEEVVMPLLETDLKQLLHQHQLSDSDGDYVLTVLLAGIQKGFTHNRSYLFARLVVDQVPPDDAEILILLDPNDRGKSSKKDFLVYPEIVEQHVYVRSRAEMDSARETLDKLEKFVNLSNGETLDIFGTTVTPEERSSAVTLVLEILSDRARDSFGEKVMGLDGGHKKLDPEKLFGMRNLVLDLANNYIATDEDLFWRTRRIGRYMTNRKKMHAPPSDRDFEEFKKHASPLLESEVKKLLPRYRLDESDLDEIYTLFLGLIEAGFSQDPTYLFALDLADRFVGEGEKRKLALLEPNFDFERGEGIHEMPVVVPDRSTSEVYRKLERLIEANPDLDAHQKGRVREFVIQIFADRPRTSFGEKLSRPDGGEHVLPILKPTFTETIPLYYP